MKDELVEKIAAEWSEGNPEKSLRGVTPSILGEVISGWFAEREAELEKLRVVKEQLLSTLEATAKARDEARQDAADWAFKCGEAHGELAIAKARIAELEEQRKGTFMETVRREVRTVLDTRPGGNDQ